jgi:preprotein translocase subunit SecY
MSNLTSLGKAQELQKRIFFVIGALIVYRIGTYIPLPGIDSRVLSELLNQHNGGLLGVFNMFSGGALGRMTIFALNVMPYITVSIVMQLLAVMYPALGQLRKEGEQGRQKLQQYTRYGTVLMSSLQAFGIANYLLSLNLGGQSAVINPGTFFIITTVVSLVGGTVFLMWLGEQITSRGIGNGISLIIFAGIVAGLPSALGQTFELGRTGALSSTLIIVIAILATALIFLIVYLERSHRRIIVQYPKRVVGNKQYMGGQNFLPLKVNTAGVLPPIFASSILLFPATIASFGQTNPDSFLGMLSTYLAHGKPLYIAAFVTMIVFFCFFYMKHVFNPVETADNLKKAGGFIPGIRPGENTAKYIEFVMTRITVLGAAYISFVCVIPEILISQYSIPFYLGGTSLLIAVSVTMDTTAQIQSYLISHQYEGLIKKNKLQPSSGRRRTR